MSVTVWKYPVPVTDECTLEMPEGAQLLTVQVQQRHIMLWALVNPEAPTHTRYFRWVATGEPVDVSASWRYVGSVQLDGGALVFHLFDV